MKKLEIKESQVILLDIAKVVNEIAVCHNIPFFMFGGTFLGAVRHKGFIPWDDDMDFAVTYDRFWEFVDILNKELPSRYKCRTYKDDDRVRTFFFKIEDTQTCLDDKFSRLPIEQKIGLNIDVFPFVSCSEGETKVIVNSIYERRRYLQRIYAEPLDGSKFKSWVKSLFRFFCRKSAKSIISEMHELIDTIKPGKQYCPVVSLQFWNRYWDKSTIEDLVEYNFEDTKFLGVREYDSFLTSCYINYMQLPPIEKQRVHSNAAYIKNV